MVSTHADVSPLRRQTRDAEVRNPGLAFRPALSPPERAVKLFAVLINSIWEQA